MLCSNCKKRNATFHYKQVINGTLTETYLCPECAKALGYMDTFHDPFDFGGLLNEFLGIGMAPVSISERNVCPSCGTDFETFRKTGLIGCENCYNKFQSNLDAMLSSIQTGTTHKGKTASYEENSVKEKQTKIEKLKADLKVAIREERYEEAAKIRDTIKEMEAEDNE